MDDIEEYMKKCYDDHIRKGASGKKSGRPGLPTISFSYSCDGSKLAEFQSRMY
jgi:hypothetical protein